MLVGHLAVGFLAKRSEPTLSLGTALLAPILSDLVLFVLVIVGVERIEFGTGAGAAAYLRAVDISYSHSLLMTAVWSALLAGAFYIWRRTARPALMLAAGVLSHWLLDVVSHVPDMPLAPGLRTYFGLGLWTSVPATVLLEGGLWITASILYAITRRGARLGFWLVFVVGCAILTLAWLQNIMGPPPPNPATAPFASLVFLTLVVLWGFWLNRLSDTLPADPKGSALQIGTTTPAGPPRASFPDVLTLQVGTAHGSWFLDSTLGSCGHSRLRNIHERLLAVDTGTELPRRTRRRSKRRRLADSTRHRGLHRRLP